MEGHKPNGGHGRAGEVGRCRSPCEAAEQSRATSYGGCGGKSTDEGEYRSVAHAHDTEREEHVPGAGRYAKGSKERTQERFTALLRHLSVNRAAPRERGCVPLLPSNPLRTASPVGVDSVKSGAFASTAGVSANADTPRNKAPTVARTSRILG